MRTQNKPRETVLNYRVRFIVTSSVTEHISKTTVE